MAQSDNPAVGFVVAATDAFLTPANAATPLKAQPGDILFPGDTLTTPTGSVTFFYCPQSAGASAFSYTVRARVVISDQARGHRPRTLVVAGKVQFDEEKGTSEFTVEIRNVSAHPLYGPLKLRAKRVTTPGATDTKFVGAEAGGTGALAAWETAGEP